MEEIEAIKGGDPGFGLPFDVVLDDAEDVDWKALGDMVLVEMTRHGNTEALKELQRRGLIR